MTGELSSVIHDERQVGIGQVGVGKKWLFPHMKGSIYSVQKAHNLKWKKNVLGMAVDV